jgi:hypothetical protein
VVVDIDYEISLVAQINQQQSYTRLQQDDDNGYI